MMKITNPILPGFHPDPSIIRVDDDYYIATSTFEWFPGVIIYHSRDLVNYRPLTTVLRSASQLNMVGDLDSGGVWAPCLSHSNGIYYLIYTDVVSRMGAFKDTHNYMVTATDIMGPWSEPIYLNSSGFDPSLFHDDDGKKWLVNMLWDHRKGTNSFAGIVLQQYCTEQQQLIGERKLIFKGTELRLTEAPHLYKRNGYYYLITAEGGTQYEHAVTLARAEHIDGPYIISPNHPILTSKHKPEIALQKAGHGSLVETQHGEWYMVHLVGRPTVDKYCTLGRETAIQRMSWTEDNWLEVEGGGNEPKAEVAAPNLPLHSFPVMPELDHFDEQELGLQWCSLRIPTESTWVSLSERRGYLRIKGQESMSSVHRQSIIARRQQAFNCEIETMIQFEPEHFQQMAGLILYYNTSDYVYLRMTYHEQLGKCLGIVQSVEGVYDECLTSDIPLQANTEYRLKAVIRRGMVQFYYAALDKEWQPVGEAISIVHLSDEFGSYIRFTGTFLGMCAQDLSGMRKHADFDYFIYKELS
ncbi:xylan 1,4-beta-xylosidase [Paenibacillus endophyticus]|uniref:Xylan 1,4-beta-xylosidase n=1 Tax=Paenibacillus endophyticus TaxID=1294268 RepID=A0A7W5GDH5_9BACL|nr:glycoside hydrolase family 43 protein [Paenibacillus endophyticus]MBB3155920.1 xylan 1,4-beta-xylosidase [Paenibacillus endophyticus]